ncbi:Acyl-protein synthetase [Petrocella atlantisensis]|uniref:Acyl-protein synthetase n=1 Tax=Petrocella atlantisensis TaxID=2173034 RepID=A0A3P7P601_9FIRM|nr:acyl-protein synthetase [Petrocella atlantisensis]MCF8018705.1 acyl-protein synthetase [Vallitaleaceae bacterium]VDN48970.1 Acyl-protein synthetase [Petrocella atlantisensis]
MNFRERLFNYKKIYDLDGSEDLFLAAMRESVEHHKTHCAFYKELIQDKGYTTDQLIRVEDIASIPTIPVDFFKTHEVKSIEKDDIKIHATSSGTMGQKSQIFIDKSTLKLGTKMIIKAMIYHKFVSIIPTNYLILGYEPKTGNEMGNVKVLTGMTKLAPAKEKVFAIRSIGDAYQIDYFGVMNALKRYARQKLPVRIMGFPSYLYMMLTAMKEMKIPPLKLNKKSIVFTGGGWKKYNDMAIQKEVLYALIEEMLGIPAENCRDFYSAVEHSVAYPECRHHHMHIPIWSRVLIRDVNTLEPLGFNQAGFLNFISPLVSSMPLNSVLMGDMAVLRDGSQCGCGITTPYFEILGRAGTRSSKTCTTSASELLGGPNGTHI